MGIVIDSSVLVAVERGQLDLAAALACGHAVATRDRRSFPLIEGLIVMHW